MNKKNNRTHVHKKSNLFQSQFTDKYYKSVLLVNPYLKQVHKRFFVSHKRAVCVPAHIPLISLEKKQERSYNTERINELHPLPPYRITA